MTYIALAGYSFVAGICCERCRLRLRARRQRLAEEAFRQRALEVYRQWAREDSR